MKLRTAKVFRNHRAEGDDLKGCSVHYYLPMFWYWPEFIIGPQVTCALREDYPDLLSPMIRVLRKFVVYPMAGISPNRIECLLGGGTNLESSISSGFTAGLIMGLSI